jgi:hypothetical protein
MKVRPRPQSRNVVAMRVYVTDSLYAAWDDIFYPEGVGAWLAKLDADTSSGGLLADERFFPTVASSAGCGSTGPGCRAATPPAAPAASPGNGRGTTG